MEDYMYGRYTTLNHLNAVRNDLTKPKFRRKQAAEAMEKIIAQLEDPVLMALRQQLIRATRAGDKHEVWKLENRILAHEGRPREAME